VRHTSASSRLRNQLSSVVTGISDLVGTLPVRRFEQGGGGIAFVGPEYYLGKATAAQQANQLLLKRNYETFAELLKLLLRGSPQDLVGPFEEADKRFRDWLELDASWSVTSSPLENAKKVQDAAKPLEQLLSVLDAVSEDEIILIPDTNSLLAASDPKEYRKVSGENSFVFMILPTVLGELDRLKVEHRNPDVREKAKKVITRIKGWRNQGPLANGVTVDKTITVKAPHTEPDMKATLSWLDSDNRDDRIIASILALQAEYPSAHVILVSGDINIQNKADAALIETIEGP
jgi:PIN domain